ncbi:hypothetical protein CC80DRAFT_556597 [Byssothecium circinans]|uniref:MFS general substrate transporter n=1 Tax=Byssothecium circinans TaxID=147558 RepID=A0A6A5T6C2_9PLEO|nr:hypothetical protein CC80DRAFT_556597 [Byssothecium circinans]
MLGRYAGDTTWTPEEEKKLNLRLDRKLIRLLTITYRLQYYDKAMLSQAALFVLREDLHLNVGDRCSFSAGILYLGFIVGSYPAILLAQRIPTARVASALLSRFPGVWHLANVHVGGRKMVQGT